MTEMTENLTDNFRSDLKKELKQNDRVTGFTGRIMTYLKSDMVFFIASLFALISSFVVRPSMQYIEYIDFRVLALLFSLMIVVAGFQSAGMFDLLAEKLIFGMDTTRKLIFALVFVCFFTSMFITNDVALITFVPFSIMVLERIKRENLMIIVIVMQTIAANLGSMFTPLGNPQNLYLFSISGMHTGSFLILMLPLTLVAAFLTGAVLLTIKNDNIKELISEEVFVFQNTGKITDKKQIFIFTGLFVLCILTVVKIMDYRLTLLIVIISVSIIRRSMMAEADYMLLLTFISFFIFVGNIKNIDFVKGLIGTAAGGNEIIASVISSQFISNVPAAILLSGFTQDYSSLIRGTNVGGLGTLIASMASLISYRLYIKSQPKGKKRYIIRFTLINLVFLVILIPVALI